MSNTGFCTLAYGRDYAEMAIDLALSIRAVQEDPISLIADPVAADSLSPRAKALFDCVIVIDDLPSAHAAKYQIAKHLPYDASIYLDADILFQRAYPIDLEWLDARGISMLGGYVERGSASVFWDWPVETLMSATDTERCFPCHAGIIWFRRGSAARFFADCASLWDHFRMAPEPGLDPALRKALLTSDELLTSVMAGRDYAVQPYEGPQPFPMTEQCPDLQPADPRWPLVHTIGWVPRRTRDAVLKGVRQRRRQARIRNTSTRIWCRKVPSTPPLPLRVLYRMRKRARAVMARCGEWSQRSGSNR